MGSGVPAGTKRPFHSYTSNPGITVSATVATAGSFSERCGDEIANARSLPPSTSGVDAATVLNMNSTCPPITSVIAGLPLL